MDEQPPRIKLPIAFRVEAKMRDVAIDPVSEAALMATVAHLLNRNVAMSAPFELSELFGDPILRKLHSGYRAVILSDVGNDVLTAGLARLVRKGYLTSTDSIEEGVVKYHYKPTEILLSMMEEVA